MANRKELDAFLNALVEDVLTDADRLAIINDARNTEWRDRMRAVDMANLAYHEARAAAARASMAWRDDRDDHPAREQAHTAAVVALISAIDTFIATPASTKGATKDKARRLKRWDDAPTGNFHAVPIWRKAMARWTSAIDTELTRTKVRGA